MSASFAARFVLSLALYGITVVGSRADEVIVVSAAAVRSSVVEAPTLFERATGHRARFTFTTAGGVRERAMGADGLDVAIAPPSQIDDLIARGFLAAGSRVDLGVTSLGVAVKSGAPRPVIDTAAALRQAFLDAPSIGLADPATGATTGVYFAKLLKDQNLAEAIAGRLTLFPDGARAMEALAAGKIALSAGQISEILPVAGVDLVGPLPDAVQLRTTYSAGVSTRAASPEAARALIRLLSGPDLAGAFKANGFDKP
jgi:molybdate transport system substrate-binding protein